MPANTIATFLAPPPDTRGNRVALRYFEAGRWKSVDANDLARSIRELAVGLHDLGVEQGGRVALLAPSSPGALIADLAVQSIGAVAVPIDPTVRSVPLARLLRRIEPRQIFVCDLAQLDRVLEIRPDLPSLDLVLLLGAHGGDEVAAAMGVERVRARGAERLRSEPHALEELQRGVTPESPALVLPAETTGEASDFTPTQGGLVAAAEALGSGLPLERGDVVLAAVPASRASHRALRLLCLSRGAEFVFARMEAESTAVDLIETQPSVLLAESGWVESLAKQGRDALGGRGATLRALYAWGVALGEGRSLSDLAGAAPVGKPWKLRIAEAALLGPFRRRWLGGRLRRIVSLGDPLSEQARRWFAALGIAALEGEDCAAASGLLALNTPNAFRPGTLGRLLPGVEGRSQGWLVSGRRLKVDSDGWVVPS